MQPGPSTRRSNSQVKNEPPNNSQIREQSNLYTRCNSTGSLSASIPSTQNTGIFGAICF